MTFDNSGGGNWEYEIKIEITSVPIEYSQYKITIDGNDLTVYNTQDNSKTSGTLTYFWDNVKSDGSDLRLYTVINDEQQQLYFWVEEWDYNNQQATIWVKLIANAEEMNIAYGNPDATESSYHDGDNTFEFFDDFEGTSLDTDKWQTLGSFDILELVNGELHVKTTKGSALVVSKQAFGTNIVIEDRGRLINREYSQAYFTQDINNLYMSAYYYYNSWYQKIFKRVGGAETDLDVDNKTLSYNVYYFRKTIIRDSEIVYELYDDNLITQLTTTDMTFSTGFLGFRMVGDSSKPSEFYADWIFVAKLADPATFGTVSDRKLIIITEQYTCVELVVVSILYSLKVVVTDNEISIYRKSDNSLICSATIDTIGEGVLSFLNVSEMMKVDEFSIKSKFVNTKSEYLLNIKQTFEGQTFDFDFGEKEAGVYMLLVRAIAESETNFTVEFSTIYPNKQYEDIIVNQKLSYKPVLLNHVGSNLTVKLYSADDVYIDDLVLLKFDLNKVFDLFVEKNFERKIERR